MTTSKIEALTENIMQGRDEIGLEDFCYYNKQISSDILVAVMSVIEANTPCAAFYLREIALFRTELITEELQGSSNFIRNLDFNDLDRFSSSDSEYDQADANMSEVKAIASPCFMPNYKFAPQRRNFTQDLGSPGLRRAESVSDGRSMGSSRQSHKISKLREVQLKKARKNWTHSSKNVVKDFEPDFHKKKRHSKSIVDDVSFDDNDDSEESIDGDF